MPQCDFRVFYIERRYETSSFQEAFDYDTADLATSASNDDNGTFEI